MTTRNSMETLSWTAHPHRECPNKFVSCVLFDPHDCLTLVWIRMVGFVWYGCQLHLISHCHLAISFARISSQLVTAWGHSLRIHHLGVVTSFFFLYSIQRAKPLSFVYNYKRFGGSYDYCDVECWLNTSISNFSFIVAQNKPDFSEVLSNGVGVLCWGIYVTMVIYVIIYLCFNLSPGRWPRPSRQSLPITERWLLLSLFKDLISV